MHTGTENKYVSLAKELKDHLEGKHRQNGAIGQVKSRKIFMERKWTERKYHVQDNALVELKYVKCIVTQINSQHYPFVFHIPNFMAQRGLSKH